MALKKFHMTITRDRFEYPMLNFTPSYFTPLKGGVPFIL